MAAAVSEQEGTEETEVVAISVASVFSCFPIAQAQ
jgi:hypothetical protein